MTEIFFIYLQLLVFIVIFQFPLNQVFLKRYSVLNFNYFEVLTLNIVIQGFFYLILSFLETDLQKYFIFQIFLGTIFLIFNFSSYLKNNFIFKNLNDNELLFLLFLIFNLILFTHVALNLRIEWDGLAHWIHKAQIYYQGGTFSDIKNVNFSYYPQFGSFLWGFFWKNSFLDMEYFGRLFFPFVYITGIFFSISNLFSKENILLKFLLLLLIFSLTLDYYLFGGYQEYLLFFELLIFSKLFYIYQKKNNFNLIFIVLFLDTVLILWTKQEGFFYNIILVIIFFIFCNKNYKTKFLFVALVVLSILIQIYLKNNLIGSFEFNEKIFHKDLLRYLNISEFFTTFILISKHIAISMFKYPIWLLIILILIFSSIHNKNNQLFNFVIFYFFIFFVFVYAIYFQTRMNLDFLLPITVDRILLQGSGFMIYPILVYLEKFVKDLR